MPYTLVLRSADRVDSSSNPNDFMIRTGLDAVLNDHVDWRVCVKQIVLSQSEQPWFHTGSAWSMYVSKFINSTFAELRLTFGGSVKSYDSRIKGSQIVHFEAMMDRNPSAKKIVFAGEQTAPIYYDIARPNSTEIRVQLFDQRGVPLQSYVGESATAQNIDDWILVLQLEPCTCH